MEWGAIGRRHGQYELQADRITLNWLLTRRQAISALAHELGHQAFGDSCSTPPVEERADEYAASMLITPTMYRRAEELVGSHCGALAVELEVTPRLVEAWRRWWVKRGRTLHSGERDSLEGV